MATPDVDDLPAGKRSFRFTWSPGYYNATLAALLASFAGALVVSGVQLAAGGTPDVLPWWVSVIVGAPAGLAYAYLFDRIVVTDDGLVAWRWWHRVRVARGDVREIDVRRKGVPSPAVFVEAVLADGVTVLASAQSDVPARFLRTLELVHDYRLSDRARAVATSQERKGSPDAWDDSWSGPLRYLNGFIVVFVSAAGAALGIMPYVGIALLAGWI